MRPRLPTAEEVLPYLRRIDENGIYSNFGPLYYELAAKLGVYFGVAPDCVALVANGTLALQAAVETVGEPGDTWVCPSWTFVASAQALMAARRRIHFVDVVRETWSMAPAAREYARGAVVVSPFGSRPSIVDWQDFGGFRVFDAASCFDAVEGIGAELDDKSVLMVSLHATKPMGVGEGAVLVGPADWIRRATVWANFGFDGSRVASGPGLNGKFNEYQAAVGLAGFEMWPEQLRLWQDRTALALRVSDSLGLETQPSMRGGFVTSTWNVVLPQGCDLRRVENDLNSSDIGTRIWWPCGVHEMPAFARQTREVLPVTEEMTSRVLGLPFGLHVGTEEMSAIEAALRVALR